jgi:hypothetical protein
MKAIMNTGKLLLVTVFLLITTDIFSQDIELTREEKKEAKKAEAYMNFQSIDSMLMRKDFVLLANYLENQYGDRVMVTSSINFVKVEDGKAVLQTGTASSVGYNGVGGVTAEGNINNWEINKNMKGLTHSVKFDIMTNIGIYSIFLTVSSNNYAQAIITGLTRGKLVYTGRLEPASKSRVYTSPNLTH